MTNFFDIIVIGGGPAGMAAALAAAEKNPSCTIMLAEREEQIGGILKQCIHDGFGLIRFQERLTGPEYAYRYSSMLSQKPNISIAVSTFVIRIVRQDTGLFELTFTNPEHGIFSVSCRALIAATGCRERTDRQLFIHGDRPSGVFTAGQAQHFINLKGFLPGKRFVILGSGDIGLIMARRLTLETACLGGSVEGVYEVKSEPSGLTRNIVQCLNDFGIPLHLSTTVSRLHGTERLEGVTVTKVDQHLQPIPGTDRYIPCDSLILSVGLIPENDILDGLAPEMDSRTKGPCVNQYMETSIPGLFSCGNALHVHDLVDYVSESGQIAGEQAALLCSRELDTENSLTVQTPQQCPAIGIPLSADTTLLYHVPSRIIPDGKQAVLYFRSAAQRGKTVLTLTAEYSGTETEVKYADAQIAAEYSEAQIRADSAAADQNTHRAVIFTKTYQSLKPPEMERCVFNTVLIPKHTGKLMLSLTDPADETSARSSAAETAGKSSRADHPTNQQALHSEQEAALTQEVAE